MTKSPPDSAHDPLIDPSTETDPWAPLRGLTRARVGQPRAGDTVAGGEVLAFQLAHARARRAVMAPLRQEALRLDGAVLSVRSQAADRATFIRRPDLGRRLSADSAACLTRGSYDVAFVIADGLSALAAERQAPPLLAACHALLPGWRIAPVVVAHNARVALGDDIAHRLGAGCVVMMIGERPGLSVSDSLSLYMTWDPRPGRLDSERNCISNIHDQGGLSTGAAAAKLAGLLAGARRIGRSGIMLKDETPATLDGLASP
ncbi:ethanolamine ammonia-lyase subunit EutC [Gluconacetobacter azotocaptans]|uniref:Ethanolamine ammonia-lyase small subunit n=1 Tax=Gluconacetobacter azotocaptans TaxID=142834 RepID=A0A7W4JTY1_9PROT|nr:ethanolamine ammonia-lyase subunit EutC [Gluconacetobacter azotocaptans]MBB2190823.1 ethanolamine ammonia-lyase subunit EutC [Gluconacetobacter azotocaptans]MBM9400731.1 ethanolamine ammonia-lyase subunit EutC [Gluconacetobacter azotocaptans]GBQ30880.1 ethanolamine ammonia-lyase small subunit [Gluconacetobacter azotocaptans DSM 13594]